MSAEVKSMDIKKPQSTSTATENAVSSKKKVQDFITDIKTEIRQISWTSKEELIVYTQIVAISTLVFGMSIYLLDVFIQGTLNGLNLLLRWIVG